MLSSVSFGSSGVTVLVFGPSVGGVIGNVSLFGLNGITINNVNAAYASGIPEVLFFAFQLKFPAITPALIMGIVLREFGSNLYLSSWFCGPR